MKTHIIEQQKQYSIQLENVPTTTNSAAYAESHQKENHGFVGYEQQVSLGRVA